MTLLNAAMHMLFLLVAGHALADRPLQTDLMRKEKDRNQHPRFIYGLAVHGLIHGGIVCLVTGFWYLGAAEVVLHALIDDAKCRKKFGLATDQALHILCKVAWTIIALILTGGN